MVDEMLNNFWDMLIEDIVSSCPTKITKYIGSVFVPLVIFYFTDNFLKIINEVILLTMLETIIILLAIIWILLQGRYIRDTKKEHENEISKMKTDQDNEIKELNENHNKEMNDKIEEYISSDKDENHARIINQIAHDLQHKSIIRMYYAPYWGCIEKELEDEELKKIKDIVKELQPKMFGKFDILKVFSPYEPIIVKVIHKLKVKWNLV